MLKRTRKDSVALQKKPEYKFNIGNIWQAYAATHN